MTAFDHQEVLEFWFDEIEPKQWWRKDPEFDAMVRLRFASLHAAVAQGDLAGWQEHPLGCLAKVIVLDQFSRNIYRDSGRAFTFDGTALTLAQCAVARGFDKQLDATQRAFLYMPYMHSESVRVHEQAVHLFSQPGLDGYLEFELRHKAIIDRFGRYPHRNSALGRESTKEEQGFLQEQGSSF